MNDYTVAWDAHGARVLATSLANVINHNVAAFLDGKPGLMVLRTHMPQHRAYEMARSYQAMLDRRAACLRVVAP